MGKTTVVRELKNRSNHQIGCVFDRGPVSRFVWNPQDWTLEKHWLQWLENSKDLIGIIVLKASWATVAPRLKAEMEYTGFNIPNFNKPKWETQQYAYLAWCRSLRDWYRAETYEVNADEPLDEVLMSCALLMGYDENIFATPAQYPTGTKEMQA